MESYNVHSSEYTVAIRWDLPDLIPDIYHITYRTVNHENNTFNITVDGVSFLYIMTVIIKTNQ